MKRNYLIGAIVGAVAATAIGATAGYKMLAEADSETNATEQTAQSAIECQDVVVEVPQEPKDPDRVAGTVAGAVVGGVVGHQFGSGSGNDAATAAGAIAGGVAGNKIQKEMQENDTREEVRQSCG